MLIPFYVSLRRGLTMPLENTLDWHAEGEFPAGRYLHLTADFSPADMHYVAIHNASVRNWRTAPRALVANIRVPAEMRAWNVFYSRKYAAGIIDNIVEGAITKYMTTSKTSGGNP